MITAIKNTNSDLYKDLFAKASEVLSGFERTQTFDESKPYYYKDSKTNSFTELVFKSEDKEGKIYEFADALTTYGYLYVSNGKNPADYNFAPELGITTLEEYYNWLPEIKRDSKGNPTVFTKLPLDEAHFEINPNTRAITIPADFKKNGIAVQGDDLAEVVYFMIDRYFDAMDLNNTEIYIEWETPKSKTSEAVKSVSETYLKIIDDENYPGKLIFGWAISDAITKDSGTLKFAVRFVQWNEDHKIVYSFNTLTAQATIHPNLGLDLENGTYDIDNCNDRLLERIEPSEVVGGAKAAIPYFLQNLVVLEEGYDIAPNHTDGTYTLSVVATADDTGVVSYIWKRTDIGEDAWIEIPGSTAVEWVALTEKEYEDFGWKLPENRIYHIERDDDTSYLLPKGYYDLTDSNTIAYFKTKFGVDIEGGEIPELYEKRSLLVVEGHGQYKAEARNRIFNSLTKASSEVVTFKTPDAIEWDESAQTREKHIIGEESATLAPVIKEAVGDLSYQWMKANSDGEFTAVETEEAKELAYTVTEPGMYKLEAVRVRNRAKVKADSMEYRITNAPEVPVFAEGVYDGLTIVPITDLLAGEAMLSVEWNNNIESDEFYVDWYLFRGDKDMNDLLITTNKLSNAYISTFNPTDALYASVFTEAKEDLEGYYYAIIKNKLNGVESAYNSRPEQDKMFSVTGS